MSGEGNGTAAFSDPVGHRRRAVRRHDSRPYRRRLAFPVGFIRPVGSACANEGSAEAPRLDSPTRSKGVRSLAVDEYRARESRCRLGLTSGFAEVSATTLSVTASRARSMRGAFQAQEHSGNELRFTRPGMRS